MHGYEYILVQLQTHLKNMNAVMLLYLAQIPLYYMYILLLFLFWNLFYYY